MKAFQKCQFNLICTLVLHSVSGNISANSPCMHTCNPNTRITRNSTFQENSDCIKNYQKAKILLVSQNDQKMDRKLHPVNKRRSKKLLAHIEDED